MTTMTLQALHSLVADDAFASTFQSVSQYRGALLRQFDILTTHPGAISNFDSRNQPAPARDPAGAACKYQVHKNGLSPRTCARCGKGPCSLESPALAGKGDTA